MNILQCVSILGVIVGPIMTYYIGVLAFIHIMYPGFVWCPFQHP